VQAFVYGFAYVYNAQLAPRVGHRSARPGARALRGGEHLWRARELLDATYRDSGCLNNDML
jgi:hypothetical protein